MRSPEQTRRRIPPRGRRVALFAIGSLLVVGAFTLWTAPGWIVPHLARRFPGCLYSVETTAPVVALTIDDGPDPTTTPALLEVLREHDARATFFLISDRIAGSESTLVALIEQGHEIGNHLTRDTPGIGLTPAEFDSALVTAGERLSAFGPVRWARPGGGRYDAGMVATMRQRGYRCALGSVYPYDAELPATGWSAAFILAHARPGSIVVLHDGGGRGRRTLNALRRVLPELRRRGIRVVSLSELLEHAAPAATAVP